MQSLRSALSDQTIRNEQLLENHRQLIESKVQRSPDAVQQTSLQAQIRIEKITENECVFWVTLFNWFAGFPSLWSGLL